MHTITLKVQDSIYDHIMFLLTNLNTKKLEIIEDKITQPQTKEFIDFSHYDIKAFKDIKDPVQWQQDIRAQWDR